MKLEANQSFMSTQTYEGKFVDRHTRTRESSRYLDELLTRGVQISADDGRHSVDSLQQYIGILARDGAYRKRCGIRLSRICGAPKEGGGGSDSYKNLW